MLAGAMLGLEGCYTPLTTQGGEHAVALYRQGQSELRAARRGGAVAASSPAETRHDAAPSTLTVDEALLRARQRSPRLAELNARADAAEAAIGAASQPNNPQLRVGQVRVDQWLDGKPQVRPMLRFSPNRPGELDARASEARASAAQARAAVAAEAAVLDAEVRWIFDDALLLEAEVTAAERAAAARRTLASRMRERLEAAEATRLDGTMAELSAVEAEQDGAERRAQRDMALAALLDLVGVEPSAQVRLVGDPTAWPPPALPPEGVLVETALRNSPAIAAVAARIDGADARAAIERGKRWPWFTSIDVGYQFAPGVPEGLGWVLQTGIELPLFHSNGAGARAAQAMSEAERRALTAETERVAREVRSRLRDTQAAAGLVGEFRERMQKTLQSAESEARRALDNRSIDALRALQIEERRAAVELRLLRLVRRYRASAAELRRAVGGRLPGEP